MSIIREHGLLTDAWSTSHEHGFLPDPENGEIDSPEEAIEEYGVTADSPLNSYSAGKTLEGIAARWKGKRLDYILYRGPARFHRRWRRRREQTPVNGLLTNGRTTHDDLSEDVPTLHCISSKVVMRGRVPGRNMSFSDHFGVEATLIIQYPSPRQVSPPPAAPTVWDTAATSASATFTPPSIAHQQRPYVDAEIPSDSHSPPTHVSVLANVTDDIGAGDAFDIEISQETVEAMLLAIGGAYRAARSRSRKQLFIFGICVVLVLATAVGSSWQPIAGLNPIFVLVGAAFTWLGTTMLYAGFIWGNWEVNWLMTVVEELELLNRGRITVAGR
jgi:sphingomyelin phosphodiesterase 2